jgi:hypothetical protein
MLKLSFGTKCNHLELMFWDEMFIIWDEMLSSGANVFIWEEILSSGMKCYHLELILSSGRE